LFKKVVIYDFFAWLAFHLMEIFLLNILVHFASCPGLQGEAGKTEDRRHRAFYHTLSDSEAKLQFFAARQVACRILGSHGYLCEHVSFMTVL
jgi:hypothetical protein